MESTDGNCIKTIFLIKDWNPLIIFKDTNFLKVPDVVKIEYKFLSIWKILLQQLKTN